jgi:hypothetical protein
MRRVFGLAVASTLFWVGDLWAQSTDAQTSCSEFKGTNHPRLERLKGTVAMSGNTVCSAAFVTFKGRSGSAPGLVLSAGHCSLRGKEQIKLNAVDLAVPDAGEVLYRVSDRRSLTLDTGNGETPRTCVESDEIIYGTLTDADILARTGVKPLMISQDTSFPNGLPVRVQITSAT